MGWGWVSEDADGGVWTSPKWGREKLQPLGPEQGHILWPCYEVGQRRRWERERGPFSSGWEHGPRGAERVPGAHSDSPCLQAVGAGQRGGGEEDFSSQLNLLKNLACSPSS